MTWINHIILANIVPCRNGPCILIGNRGVHHGPNGRNAINPVDGDGKTDIANVVHCPACVAIIGKIGLFKIGKNAINTNVVSLL